MNTEKTQLEQLSVAICSYNCAVYLPELLDSLITIACPIPFEIVLIDNNSTDNTREIVFNRQKSSPVPIRYVKETEQGIANARNRAIQECLHHRYMAFIDADELPGDQWLQAAVHGLKEQGAECVGGRISLRLPYRPKWLSVHLTPFLGELDFGAVPFPITHRKTPVWAGNVAYRTAIFLDGLRFDTSYNRKGKGIGGGEDGQMFRGLLANNTAIRYEPNMHIIHRIEKEKLQRRYFLKLHYLAGVKTGLYEEVKESRHVFGIPRFMFLQLAKRVRAVLKSVIEGNENTMREAMNLTNQLGLMKGIYNRAHGKVSD